MSMVSPTSRNRRGHTSPAATPWPHHLGDLVGPAVEGPVEDRDAPICGHAQAGLDLLEVEPAVFGMAVGGLGEGGLVAGVVAEEGDRGHVPVDAGGVDAEAGDGVHPHRADDAGQRGGHRVERPAHPVVVEGVGVDAEDLSHPFPGPVLNMQQRLGRGQPVSHQSLDDLAVSGDGHVTHRAGPVDDAADVEATAELRDRRQCAEHLVAYDLRWPQDRSFPCHRR